MLYNNQRIAKKKTHVKKRTLNPVFNESFLFDIPYNEGLQNISMEFLVMDWDRMTKNEVIGRLEIGGKSSGQELHHWNEVMNCPRKQIAEWHKLREWNRIECKRELKQNRVKLGKRFKIELNKLKRPKINVVLFVMINNIKTAIIWNNVWVS